MLPCTSDLAPSVQDTDDISDHDMHSEVYMMSKEAAEILNRSKEERQTDHRRRHHFGKNPGIRLEQLRKISTNAPWRHRLFIYPGYKWQAIDGMLTNFHLPKSTLIMMICALAGYDLVMKAYRHAVEEKYRFFSFGDCMFLTHED